MNKLFWEKALSYGVVLWVTMFILAAISLGLNITLTTVPMLVLAVIAGLVAYGLTTASGPADTREALGYGAVFAAIGIVLDLLISRVFRPGIFAVWTYWLGYMLILFAPTAAIGNHQSTHAHV